MSAIVQKVESMSRDDVIEALLAIEPSINPHVQDAEALRHELEAELADNPYSHTSDVEMLARSALVIAAQDLGLEAEVQRAIELSGRKAFVFGGAEILAAGVLGACILQIILSKGKAEVTERVEMQYKDGEPVFVYEKRTKWGIGGKVANLLTKFIPGVG